MTSRNSIDHINRKYKGSGALLPATHVSSVLPANPIISNNLIGGGLRSSYIVGPSSIIQPAQPLIVPPTTLISRGVVNPVPPVVISGGASRLPISTVSPVRTV